MAAIFYTLATLKDKLGDKDRGAGVVEYALVLGGISVLLVLGAVAINTGLGQFWTDLTTFLGRLGDAGGPTWP